MDQFMIPTKPSASDAPAPTPSASTALPTTPAVGPKGMIASVPRYIVNLDLPADERWNQIADDYKADMAKVEATVKKEIKTLIGPRLGPALDSIISNIMAGASHVSSSPMVHFSDELKAIAARTGMKLGRMVTMQLVYEASACCTSVVAPSADGTPLHIRTMDWGMDFLKSLTIEVEFQKGGKPLYTATTWAGYVGILTAMKPNVFSLSVNFRHTGGTFWTNLKKALTSWWPVGFMVREVFEGASDFASAVKFLSTMPLIAPAYFTVAGCLPNEGVLITRRRKKEENRWDMGVNGPIVQTNIDHWSSDPNDDILYSIERRGLMRNNVAKGPIRDETQLWQMMSEPPIINDLTVYGSFMCPAKGILHTRFPVPFAGFAPFFKLSFDQDHVVYVPGDALGDEATHTQLKLVPPPVRPTCQVCNTTFTPFKNTGGGCVHNGKWHATLADCSYVKCGFGLGPSHIGYQHWSCCYDTSQSSNTCPKSSPHVAHSTPSP